MRRRLFRGTLATLALGAAALTAACDPATDAEAQTPRSAARAERPSAGLQAFASDAELRRFLLARRPRPSARAGMAQDAVAAPAPMATESAAAPESNSITNVQEAGVDEGGIVKVRGDTLVILRRGRLFTVSTDGGGLRAVHSINAYPPGVDASGDWYDELLISGDRVIVIGYSYERGGTEVSRFRLSPDGRLSFEDAYHLKSNDYYSSRNYASRLIGDQLVLYTPLYLSWGEDPLNSLPAMRRWTARAPEPFRRIAQGTDVYVSPRIREDRDAEISTLHSLIRCDLSAPVLDCDATVVLGPQSRTFYVSPSAIYLWLAEYGEGGRRPAASVHRLPLSGDRPSAVSVRGAPVDQFSFQENRRAGVLNVLVRPEGGGDAMWQSEFSQGSVALARVPLDAFGDGSRQLAARQYRNLPADPETTSYSFRNRFIGDRLVYGYTVSDPRTYATSGGRLVSVATAGGPVTDLPLPHGVNRIEALGGDALIVGDRAGDLQFSELELRGAPRLAAPWTLPQARETESRSHGFFYRPDGGGAATGVLGLPVGRNRGASTLFLRRANGFTPLGELVSRARGDVNDGCVASCTDWYGNARPIFLGRRTFALMGYELVEGEMTGDRVREVRRLDYSPRGQARSRSG